MKSLSSTNKQYTLIYVCINSHEMEEVPSTSKLGFLNFSWMGI